MNLGTLRKVFEFLYFFVRECRLFFCDLESFEALFAKNKSLKVKIRRPVEFLRFRQDLFVLCYLFLEDYNNFYFRTNVQQAEEQCVLNCRPSLNVQYFEFPGS